MQGMYTFYHDDPQLLQGIKCNIDMPSVTGDDDYCFAHYCHNMALVDDHNKYQ